MDWRQQIEEEHLVIAVQLQSLNEMLSGEAPCRTQFLSQFIAFAELCRSHLLREQALFRATGIPFTQEHDALHFWIRHQLAIVLAAQQAGADPLPAMQSLMESLSAAIRLETRLVSAVQSTAL